MTTISVQLKTACPTCGENLPVNGVVESLWCFRCQGQVRIDVSTWKKLLESPAIDGPRAEPGRHEVSVVQADRPFIRDFARTEAAACGRCGGAIPLPDALAHSGRGWCVCVQCGDHVSVRALPPSFAGLGGVTHLIGEDIAQLTAGGPVAGALAEATAVPCPSCGGMLSIDALSQRSAPCKYCGAGVVVPDAVWARLHPVPTQRAWYLRHDPATAAPGAGAAPSFAWGELAVVAADAEGNLYFLGVNGNRGRTLVAWSCDASFRPRWKVHDIPGGGILIKPNFSLTPDGRMRIWGMGRHSMVVLSGADGSTVATLGGPEPEGATAHHLDVQHLRDLASDTDGSMLGLIYDRILRWSVDGTPIETWPPTKGFFGGVRHQKLESLHVSESVIGTGNSRYAADPPDLAELKDRPLAVRAGEWAYAVMDRAGTLTLAEDTTIRQLARGGARLWSVTLPSSVMGRPAIDARGYVYVLGELRRPTHGIYRISPDGKEVKLLVDGGATGTPLCDERCLAVLPDGAIVVVARRGLVRIFAPDGSSRFASDAARKADAERAKEIAAASR